MKEERLNKQKSIHKILENKVVKVILNILLGISSSCLTLVLLDNKGVEYFNILLPVLSFCIIEIFTFKFNVLNIIFKNNIKPIRLIISFILGCFVVYNFQVSIPLYSNLDAFNIFTFLSIPAISIYLYWFYSELIYLLKNYIKTIDKIEKYYLIGVGILLLFIIIIVYTKTNVFHYGILNNQNEYYNVYYTENIDEKDSRVLSTIRNMYLRCNYDIIYTTDTSLLVGFDVYNNIVEAENSIKQPLFGVFSIPFSIIPKVISLLLPINNIYPILLAIVQGLLALLSFTLLARIMKLRGISKTLFLIIITISASTLLFILNLEQYVISVFYLILFIYMSISKMKNRDMAYIMATGCTLTTGILFPLFLEKGNIKQQIKKLFFAFLKCMAIFIVSARIVLFLPSEIKEQSQSISQYSELIQIQNIIKYTNFARDTIYNYEFKEETVNHTFEVNEEQYKYCFNLNKPVIRPVDTDKISYIGIIILVLTILGFILNRKDSFMQICFIWVIFSFILLAIMGWGVKEDGLILYSFYFGWAFICLIFKGIEKMLSKLPKIKNTLYITTITSMLIININTILQMIQFGIKYYSF